MTHPNLATSSFHYKEETTYWHIFAKKGLWNTFEIDCNTLKELGEWIVNLQDKGFRNIQVAALNRISDRIIG